MLSGQIKSFDDIPEKDIRRILPRFQTPNFENNMKFVKKLETLAETKKCTSAQLALAWVVSLSKKKGMSTIIPIPGATTVDRVIENGKASDAELNEEEMAEIEQILAACEVPVSRRSIEDYSLSAATKSQNLMSVCWLNVKVCQWLEHCCFFQPS